MKRVIRFFKKLAIVVGIFVVVIAILLLIGWYLGTRDAYPDSPEPTTQQPMPEMSIEYKLATIDKGYVSEDDITITRFRSLLQQLDAKYADNKQGIADSTVMAQKLLREEGIEESLLNIMEGMNQLFSSESVNLEYTEYATAYVVLREKGQSHRDAIVGLRGILQAFGIY